MALPPGSDDKSSRPGVSDDDPSEGPARHERRMSANFPDSGGKIFQLHEFSLPRPVFTVNTKWTDTATLSFNKGFETENY
jgi:hypothetical protein